MIDEDKLFDRLIKLVNVYIPDDKKDIAITLETDFLKDLHINSTHLVDIILDVEDDFDIEISDIEAEQMLTVDNALNIIKKKVSR